MKNLYNQHDQQRLKNPLMWMIITAGGSFLVVSLLFLGLLSLYVQADPTVLVPELKGLSLEQALYRLQERNLYPYLISQFSQSHEDKGKVIGQDPDPGKSVKLHRSVRITISKGAFSQRVEDYVGRSLKEVRDLFRAEELEPVQRFLYFQKENVVYQHSVQEPGTVLEQNPQQGRFISTNTPLFLVVSAGPLVESLEVGDYVGKSLAEALDEAYSQKFSVNLAMVPTQGLNELRIIAQDEEPSVQVSPDTSLLLTVGVPAEQGESYKLLTHSLPHVPVVMEVRLEWLDPQRQRTILFEGNAYGKEFHFVYSQALEGSLLLFVFEELVQRWSLEKQEEGGEGD